MRLRDRFSGKGEHAQTQRDKIVSYKRFFESDEGKEILIDLMNKYHVLNAIQGSDIERAHAEGQRSVVLEIIRNSKINLEQFDALVSGKLA